jgi:serine/threonine-protein kinase
MRPSYELQEYALHTEAVGTPPPDAFGPFRVLHQIGAGALGPVFRAYDPDADRLVAIKLFRLDLPPDRVHRLVAEFEALRLVDLGHRAFARPLNAGIVEVTAYLVHEFVAADSLDIVIRDSGPSRPSDALRVATELAGALDAGAAAGVLHGSLHPRDVLVSPEDTRLTGVGISEALERIGCGSPVRRPYTAPERSAGKAWDRRADLFSLAALVYEMLWARRVAGLGAQAAAALSPIAGADLDRLRQVFARALAESPRDRFESGEAFVEALREALNATPSPAEKPRPSQAPLINPLDHVQDLGNPWNLENPEPPAHRDSLFAAIDSAAPPPARAEERTAPEDDEGFEASLVTTRGSHDLDLRHGGEPDVIASDLLKDDAPASEAPSSAADVLEAVAATMDARGAASVAGVTEPAAEAARSDLLFDRPFSAPEPSARGFLPLVLALIVGLSVGFAAGYGVGSGSAPSERGLEQQAAAPAPTDLPGGAEVTGTTEVAPPPPAVPADAPPAAPPEPPRAADASPRSVPAAAAAAKSAPAAVDGRIVVRSTPPGARVILDGQDVGRTPFTATEVSQGSHTVRLMRDGYAPAERRVTVTARRPAPSVSVQLTRARRAAPPEAPASASAAATTGALMIESRPRGATVYVDGKFSGTTPMLMEGLDIGDHMVSIEAEGYRPWSSSVRIGSGERSRIAVSLEQ